MITENKTNISSQGQILARGISIISAELEKKLVGENDVYPPISASRMMAKLDGKKLYLYKIFEIILLLILEAGYASADNIGKNCLIEPKECQHEKESAVSTYADISGKITEDGNKDIQTADQKTFHDLLDVDVKEQNTEYKSQPFLASRDSTSGGKGSSGHENNKNQPNFINQHNLVNDIVVTETTDECLISANNQNEANVVLPIDDGNDSIKKGEGNSDTIFDINSFDCQTGALLSMPDKQSITARERIVNGIKHWNDGIIQDDVIIHPEDTHDSLIRNIDAQTSVQSENKKYIPDSISIDEEISSPMIISDINESHPTNRVYAETISGEGLPLAGNQKDCVFPATSLAETTVSVTSTVHENSDLLEEEDTQEKGNKIVDIMQYGANEVSKLKANNKQIVTEGDQSISVTEEIPNLAEKDQEKPSKCEIDEHIKNPEISKTLTGNIKADNESGTDSLYFIKPDDSSEVNALTLLQKNGHQNNAILSYLEEPAGINVNLLDGILKCANIKEVISDIQETADTIAEEYSVNTHSTKMEMEGDGDKHISDSALVNEQQSSPVSSGVLYCESPIEQTTQTGVERIDSFVHTYEMVDTDLKDLLANTSAKEHTPTSLEDDTDNSFELEKTKSELNPLISPGEILASDPCNYGIGKQNVQEVSENDTNTSRKTEQNSKEINVQVDKPHHDQKNVDVCIKSNQNGNDSDIEYTSNPPCTGKPNIEICKNCDPEGSKSGNNAGLSISANDSDLSQGILEEGEKEIGPQGTLEFHERDIIEKAQQSQEDVAVYIELSKNVNDNNGNENYMIELVEPDNVSNIGHTRKSIMGICSNCDPEGDHSGNNIDPSHISNDSNFPDDSDADGYIKHKGSTELKGRY